MQISFQFRDFLFLENTYVKVPISSKLKVSQPKLVGTPCSTAAVMKVVDDDCLLIALWSSLRRSNLHRNVNFAWTKHRWLPFCFLLHYLGEDQGYVMNKAKMFDRFAALTEEAKRKASKKRLDYERRRSVFEHHYHGTASKASTSSSVATACHYFSLTVEQREEHEEQIRQIETELQRRREDFRDKAKQFER